MRKYVPKDDVQKKSYYTDRFWVAPRVPKEIVQEGSHFDNVVKTLSDVIELKEFAIEFGQLRIVINSTDNFKALETLKDKSGYTMLSEMSAVDYLLKPFSKKRFDESLDKLFVRLENKDSGESQIEKIKKHLVDSDEVIHRVVIKKSGKIHVISTMDINYLEAQDDYVMIYTDGERFLKQQTMKYFEKHLDREQFIRVHRSYIVNVQRIERIEPYEKTNYILILKDGNKIPVSRSGMQVMKEKLNF